MKRVILFCFVLFCFVVKNRAQNLVPNASFELNNNCTSLRLENLVNWCQIGGGGGSSVYFSPCHNDAFYSTPTQYFNSCFQSYQSVRTGSIYINIANYTQSTTQESKIPYVKLIDTLKAGKTYCVTYYVSMLNNARYSLDKLGALFTATQVPCWIPSMSTPTTPIAGLYTPQVVTTPGVVFEDTLNWMEVSGSFTAVGNEAYLAIGDFFTHAQHYIKDSYPTNCNGLAEYYVDDVSVEEVEIAKARNDTLIMQGDSAIIGANNSEAAVFSWQPTASLSCTNCPNPKASPTITTTYTVTKTQCKVTTTDVITVSVSPTGVNELNISNAVNIAPNPTNGLITINSKFDIERIELLNLTGQILLSEPLNKKEYQLQLQDFAEGIYFVKCTYANGLNISRKIVKQ